MDVQKLIHMANQIGDFFESWPDRDEALAGIAEHLRKFWEPHMRLELLGLLECGEAEALKPLVRASLLRYRDTLTPRCR